MHIAIIGAGIAGLTCSRELVRNNYQVTLLEKSRGYGGRLCTRQIRQAPVASSSANSFPEARSFDHGAPYFTVRSPLFAEEVATWQRAGWASAWQPRLAKIDMISSPSLSLDTEQPPLTRYVGSPAMFTIGQGLAQESMQLGAQIHLQTQVNSVMRSNKHWKICGVKTLHDEQTLLELEADLIIMAVPADQVGPLLPTTVFPDDSDTQSFMLLKQAAHHAALSPCWALMLDFGQSLPFLKELAFDAAFIKNSLLSWVARDSSKPQRQDGECWVLHASPQWSKENLEFIPEHVAQLMLEAFEQLLVYMGKDPADKLTPHLSLAHRWRYAQATASLGAGLKAQPFYWDKTLGLGLCGDWCSSPHVEGAFLSGLLLAQCISEQVKSKLVCP